MAGLLSVWSGMVGVMHGVSASWPVGRGGVVMARFEVPDGWVAQAYRFALDPTPAQVSMLESHCGAARFAFNHMLGVVKANLEQRSAERSYGIAEQDLTPSQGWSLAKLRKTWNARKDEVAPSVAAATARSLQLGVGRFGPRPAELVDITRSGQRAGAAVGFPRLKTRHRCTRSVRFTTGAIRVEADRHHVRLPRLGAIRAQESTRKLARRLQAGTARILSATVSFTGGRWQCAFQVIVAGKTRPAHARRSPHQAVGVDVGVKDLLVVATPDGVEVARVAAPKPLTRAQSRLRAAQRCAARQCDPTTPRRRPAGALQALAAGHRPSGAHPRAGSRNPGPGDPPRHHRPGDPTRGRRGRKAVRQEPEPPRRAAQTRPRPGPSGMPR